MSRVVDEKRDRKGAARSREKSSPFVVFRPTEAEKRIIVEEGLNFNDCLLELTPFLLAGHRLSVGFKAENEAIYVHLREGGRGFGEGICVSCWHSSLERALQMMVYALRTRWSAFPHVQLGFEEDGFDW